jgi:hypothetical protein
MKTPVFLDRTHIRFFHKASAFSLVHSPSWKSWPFWETGPRVPEGDPRSRLLNRLTLGLLRDSRAKQQKSLLA